MSKTPTATIAHRYRTSTQWLKEHAGVALWIAVAWFTAAMLAHGYVACGAWMDDGCYQQVSGEGQYEVMFDSSGITDRLVGVGATPGEAWSMAVRACGDVP